MTLRNEYASVSSNAHATWRIAACTVARSSSVGRKCTAQDVRLRTDEVRQRRPTAAPGSAGSSPPLFWIRPMSACSDDLGRKHLMEGEPPLESLGRVGARRVFGRHALNLSPPELSWRGIAFANTNVADVMAFRMHRRSEYVGTDDGAGLSYERARSDGGEGRRRQLRALLLSAADTARQGRRLTLGWPGGRQADGPSGSRSNLDAVERRGLTRGAFHIRWDQ